MTSRSIFLLNSRYLIAKLLPIFAMRYLLFSRNIVTASKKTLVKTRIAVSANKEDLSKMVPLAATLMTSIASEVKRSERKYWFQV